MTNYVELVQNVEDGIESPFKAMAILKELQNDIKQCIEQVQPILVSEASKYEKTFEMEGLKIEQRAGRRVWNFKGCESWNTYDKAKKDCEERLKSAYINSQKGITLSDQEGEVIEVPEVTFSSDVVVIKNLGESLLR